MKNLESISIRHLDGKLTLLDQQFLPHVERWEKMIDCIKKLKVRGAPLIGVSAALALGKLVESGASKEQFLRAAEKLRNSRPTAVNLMWAIDKLINCADEDYSKETLISLAEEIFNEDVKLCKSIGQHGAKLINDGDKILTHCNTGGLATAGIGTALGVIQEAYQQGKNIHVYVDETRPLLQGGRLTTWELKKLDIPYTLICDNMAASLMAKGKIQKVIVGADRIAVNGDFANKIGTYSCAVNAKYHGLTFMVAAPYSTLDKGCLEGKDIPVEQRENNEVRGVKGEFGEVLWAPDGAEVYNPAFDVTPAELTDYWIMDKGYYNREQVRSGKLKEV